MKLTYDPEADAAYLTLGDTIAPGSISHTVEFESPAGGTMLLADVDTNGRILGFEFIGAQHTLDPALLRDAPLP
ncbi:DUF2283 domain-containing protein [Agromyces mediolanus]|uniref:DUF2283 domain-containing protein n=1 Tax=Agromyces mediolanus TaxID=41986 RepID=A0A918CLB4_AGRME|nr:DUF2283 domain-containing protein [Agromyces mediolanus]GGR31058.1 hypothetical protein GCM10010196_26520 [Agromyces mediolanus]GLJ72448.1 hypothetical protein GCM10017583_17040 [Agromyces mediolanus]